MLDRYVVASTVIFAAMCWGADFKAHDSDGLNKLIKKQGLLFVPACLSGRGGGGAE